MARSSGAHGLGRGTKSFRTPSGSVSANARRSAESKGDAMPGGRFPIRDRSDLKNAEHDFGRANDKPAVRKFIDKRAKALGAPPMGGDKGKRDTRPEGERHPRSHAEFERLGRD